MRRFWVHSWWQWVHFVPKTSSKGSNGMVQTVTNWFKLDDTGLTRLRQVWAKVWWFDEKGQFRVRTNGIWNVPFLNVQSWTTLRPLAWFFYFSRFAAELISRGFTRFTISYGKRIINRFLKRSSSGSFTQILASWLWFWVIKLATDPVMRPSVLQVPQGLSRFTIKMVNMETQILTHVRV